MIEAAVSKATTGRDDSRGLKGGDNRPESLPRIAERRRVGREEEEEVGRACGGARMKYYRSCRVGSRFIALASD